MNIKHYWYSVFLSSCITHQINHTINQFHAKFAAAHFSTASKVMK